MEALVKLSFYCFAASSISLAASAVSYIMFTVGRVKVRAGHISHVNWDHDLVESRRILARIGRRRPIRIDAGCVRSVLRVPRNPVPGNCR